MLPRPGPAEAPLGPAGDRGYSQSRCFFLGPMTSWVVALQTVLETAEPVTLCWAAVMRSVRLWPDMVPRRRAGTGQGDRPGRTRRSAPPQAAALGHVARPRRCAPPPGTALSPGQRPRLLPPAPALRCFRSAGVGGHTHTGRRRKMAAAQHLPGSFRAARIT